MMEAHRRRQRLAEGEKESPIKAWARKAFADHVMTPEVVKSFTFRRARGGSSYWFGLTWRPGHLSLVGDVGEMTLTHYQALAEFEPGIRWAAGGDFSYLIEKSDKRGKDLDRSGTVEDILRMADEGAVWALEGVVKERRKYRRDVAKGMLRFEAALAEWDFWRRLGVEDEDDRPRLEDYTPEHYREEEAGSSRFTKKERADWRGRWGGDAFVYGHEPESQWHVPDGFELWFRIWEAVRHRLDFHDTDPNIVLTPNGRWRLEEALTKHLDDDEMHPNAVADFCRGTLNIDDYYGDYKYKEEYRWMVEAIHHGCNMILDEIHPKRTWGKTWGDPVV
ncbi:hypothetical protein [Methylobacterium aquaticum]|uniref:Uncharacterized protein n=1 Tax=Methylobacterium aquaticum TaxID=270351 RepID=A0A0C6FTE6_9HYPH|nr:hypothetical protein [Methylobacterium aquaticum]BAQ50362.1 hypothetical protein Maq22A_4p60010 [Methylobacterium aquaticum]